MSYKEKIIAGFVVVILAMDFHEDGLKIIIGYSETNMKNFSSCIYSGLITHKRFKPKKHFFSYNTFSLLIDLKEVDDLDKKISFFSYNKFNILSFYNVDHGPRDGSSLSKWVKKNLIRAKNKY